MDRYKLFSKDRKERSGVGLYIKEKIECIEVSYGVPAPLLVPTIQKTWTDWKQSTGGHVGDHRAAEPAI